ncbi:MAG TPA: DUF4265 domain-containing protein [Kofleriaceae bacterium]|nr:DUF4265 domain-containing protein [Kofleriaceae bacterium]
MATESLWARSTAVADRFLLDSVPFFAKVATLGDTVEVRRDADGTAWFASVVTRAEVSLVRAVIFDSAAMPLIVAELRGLGCVVELFARFKLLAASVPFSVSLATIQGYLASRQSSGILDYEEPILRHP